MSNDIKDCESNTEVIAEAVTEIVQKNPPIGYILAIGISAALIATAIFAVIYGVNWLHEIKPQSTKTYELKTDSDIRRY